MHRLLEGYRLPSRLRGGSGEHGPLPERLSPIFRDRDDLSSAGRLGPQIEAALAESEALVVICSPDAARSAYVDSEIRTFKRLGRGHRIYAFIVGGEPNAGDARECFPQALRFDTDPDDPAVEIPANPIAADARPGKDGKSLATLKLLAGLFGLPLDTLRQREAHRRHQRMAAITGLAVLVMLVTSALAVQAVIARKDAERRQKQAEALVDFMLGDLNDKLSEVGRLDILSAVNDKAMAYFKTLPTTDITDEALEQRAKALVKIGIVRSEQGDFPKAMDSFRAAAALSAPLAKAMPRNLGRQLAHADVLAYIGVTHWYQGDLDGARRSFDATLDVLTAARRFKPDDPQLLYQLATIDNNNGHVLEADGRFEEATMHYRRMREVSRRLAMLDPAKVEWQALLAVAQNNLAKMALMEGDLPGAIAGYREETAIKSRLVERDPRNNAQRENLLIARATLGRTLALAGKLDEGAALMRQAVADAERLNAMEPASTNYRYDIGLYASQLARIERLLGHTEEADRRIQQSLAMLQTLTRSSPDQTAWQRDLAETMGENAALIVARSGDVGQARSHVRDALRILEPQLAKSPQDRDTVLSTVGNRLRLASLAEAGERRTLATRALATIRAQRSARRDPRLLALEADALARLGRIDEAKTVSAALAITGYVAHHPASPPGDDATTPPRVGRGSPAPPQDAATGGSTR